MVPVVCFLAIENAQINETTKVNKFFEEAYERYYTAPTEGVSSSTIQFNLQLQHQN